LKTKSIEYNTKYDMVEIQKMYYKFDSIEYGSSLLIHMSISDEKRHMKVCLEEYE
jgi:hypothetical protein